MELINETIDNSLWSRFHKHINNKIENEFIVPYCSDCDYWKIDEFLFSKIDVYMKHLCKGKVIFSSLKT